MLDDGISSTVGLTGVEAGGNSSVVSSVVCSWDTMADGVPCADRSTACSGALAGFGCLVGGGMGMDFCRFGCVLVLVGALRFI